MVGNKTWFVTGASSGFGRIWTEAALSRGDKVFATARDESVLADLTDRFGDLVATATLDVTDRAAVFASVEAAPGESAEVRIALPRRAFETWDEDANAWALRTGSYEVHAAHALDDSRLSATVEI